MNRSGSTKSTVVNFLSIIATAEFRAVVVMWPGRNPKAKSSVVEEVTLNDNLVPHLPILSNHPSVSFFG